VIGRDLGRWVSALLLASAVFAAYAPVLTYEFVDFDDTHVLEHARGGLSAEGIRWALEGNDVFPPLAWLAHMLDVELFGLSPGAHHLSNLLLHAFNAVLLFLVLGGMTGQRGASLFVAGLFALHPLNVESVAWVSEKKNLLSTLFWIVGMGAYARYARVRSRSAYAGVVACLVLGLASKPALVTFPFALLLLDLWPLGRWKFVTPSGAQALPFRSLLVEKIPLFALIALASLWTLRVQAEAGAVASATQLPLVGRLANAVVSYGLYLRRLVWPDDLAPFYANLAVVGLPSWTSADLAITSLVLLALSVAACATLRRWPFGFVGLAWFLGVMVPTIGLVQVGDQALADRYMYVPIIGCGIAIAWTLEAAVRARPATRALVATLGLIVLVLCAWGTRLALPHWRGTLPLWERSLATQPEHWIAANNVAWLLATCPDEETRDGERAVALAELAVRITRRGNATYLDTLAAAYAESGRFDAAIEVEEEALRLAEQNAQGPATVAFAETLRQLNQRQPIRSRQGCPGYPLIPEN
jgi:tetratricopeptide (TPR) repeat protein